MWFNCTDVLVSDGPVCGLTAPMYLLGDGRGCGLTAPMYLLGDGRGCGLTAAMYLLAMDYSTGVFSISESSYQSFKVYNKQLTQTFQYKRSVLLKCYLNSCLLKSRMLNYVCGLKGNHMFKA